jgi:excisionase family DNA binding protein
MDRLMVSVAEACEMLSLGRTTIYKLIGDGRLIVVKVGRRTLIRVSSIRELVADTVVKQGVVEAAVVGGSPSG